MNRTLILRTMFAFLVAGFVAVGCSDVTEPAAPTASTAASSGSTASKTPGNTILAQPSGSGFTLVLISSNVPDGNGGYVWTWEVIRNEDQPFPINHMVIPIDPCVDLTTMIAGYRSDDQEDWHAFNVHYGTDDNSMGCDDGIDPAMLVYIPSVSSPNGYFRLVFNTSQYIPEEGTAVWKAGPQCGTLNFMSVGCEDDDGGGGQGDNEGCSYSLGFYFASPVSAGNAIPGWGWSDGGYVTIGLFDYYELEARAIFDSKNGKTGMTPARLSFLQVVAIMLSEQTIAPTASVWTDFWTCYNYLAGLNVKLTPTNINSFGKTPKYVQAAAGRIGKWIDAHHCDDLTP